MRADKTDDISKVLEMVAELAPRLDPRTLHLFVDELLRWNPRLGLVSKRKTPDVIAKLIRQSIHLWDFVVENTGLAKAHTRVRGVDFGTGGGFPGLVCKMLAPELELALVDRKDRKVAFLERVIARAGFEAVDVFALDFKDFSRREAFQGVFDFVVSMAVSRPEHLAADVGRVLRFPGFFCTVRRQSEAPPVVLGRSLRIRSQLETPEGQMVLYENTPPLPRG